MRKTVIRLAVGTFLILIALTPLISVSGLPSQLPKECEVLAFSTEEDFVTQGPVPPDGNPIISDGDLLTAPLGGTGLCTICARNADLLLVFEVPVDLGLDAADVVDAEAFLVAFSTELNSPQPGKFTAGDLLVTNGAIIPNQALTYALGQGAITYDIGLDGVHFVGDPGAIRSFLGAASQYSRDEWLDPLDRLVGLLAEHGIDLWISIEGTWSAVGAPSLLDGDLLSVGTGVIVAGNGDLLPADVPAGLPDRGVDFGLDAVTADRGGWKEQIHFSTEILFDGETSFTDGDVLRFNNGVVLPHNGLVVCFEPMAKFLGLDALHMTLETPSADVEGRKFHDLNKNGEWDGEEPPLEKWEIHLKGTDSMGQPVDLTRETGATGVYSFTVPPGEYTVSEVCPPRTWTQTLPPQTEVCGDGVYDLSVSPGQPFAGLDFGNYEVVQRHPIYLPLIFKDYQ